MMIKTKAVSISVAVMCVPTILISFGVSAKSNPHGLSFEYISNS